MNLWCPDDVSRILHATHQTLASVRSAVPSLDPDAAQAYHSGFADALQAIAVAFGLQAPAPPPRPASFHPRPSWGLIDHRFLDARPTNDQRPSPPRLGSEPSRLER